MMGHERRLIGDLYPASVHHAACAAWATILSGSNTGDIGSGHAIIILHMARASERDGRSPPESSRPGATTG